ncbi:MAG: prepilin-type N-terminal cleavage/methylation domain-containing protein, partial [Lachnospiraceae bacterium]|nr:prepilin-type N-terminal cleavage/methylation domain-containing protein [Lachnospiraceae bacterium]
MMNKRSKIRINQLNTVPNNKGFSLVELLVAMVILMVVSIPLLHAFVTTAYTNRDASRLMSATDAAENIMEKFEYQDIEELVNLYNVGDNVVTVDNTSSPYNMEKYSFVIKNSSDLPDDMPDGYYAKVTLDPDLYPNANSLNVADIKSMSAAEAAVYTMSDTYDKGVYDQFVTWNTDWYNSNPVAYLQKDENFFKDNLKRHITVSINKIKTETNEFDEDVDICTVSLKIEYELSNYSGILSADKCKYVSSEVELFNNIATQKPLNNIYIVYMPRYSASINHKGY